MSIRICLCTQRDGVVRLLAAPAGGFSAFMMISALVADLLNRRPTIMFRRRYALKRMGCRARLGAESLCRRTYLLSRLTVISGTSAPGVTINTDWWLPRVVKVMLDVTPGAWATACT